jgi:hypothetical protein
MRNWTFTAFGTVINVTTDTDPMGGIYDLRNAMAQANEVLHTIPEFIADSNGSWMGEGQELRWVPGNFHD